MIWLLVNNLDYNGAQAFIDERFPVFDVPLFSHSNQSHVINLECHTNPVTFANNMNSPRCLKAHLAVKYLPDDIQDGKKKPKIIYIARNPKDVCVSSYYYCNNTMKVLDCSFEEFADMFLDNYAWPSENYWDHVLYFWDRRHESNILFIKYEDMKKNLLGVIRDVSKFLDKTLTSEQEDVLLNWLDIKSMKDNPAVNHNDLYGREGFIRSGKIGEHKEKMSSEILSKFDNWIKENTENTDYQP
ncbi:hypothetical protein RN001_006369 [Aquatica leii]|uniref:Sulfotransferase domain-containing protein n=1 Tax=Aquatica leii TaxID=1421715 RepID=A0AAN7SS86_9COLE|nr:hypothetical protein RN001_006369 [Aquatica leii]